jgi:hypothetical protein
MGVKGEKVGGEPLARGCRPAPDERLRRGLLRSDGRQVADDATSKKRREHQVVAVVARSPSERKGGESARAARCQSAAIHPTAEAAAREVWYLLSCGADPPLARCRVLSVFIRDGLNCLRKAPNSLET